MPTYHYRCDTCGKETMMKMAFGSAEKPSCETCAKPMTKFIVPPTVHFKGAGFYKTDAHKKTDTSTPTKSTVEKKQETPTPKAA